MSISFTYRPSYKIASGIIVILLGNLIFFTTITLIYTDLLSNIVIKDQIYLLVVFISEPVIIWYGIHLIIKGRLQIDLQFSEVIFKSYKNHKLELEVPVEQIESIIITHADYTNPFLFYNVVFKELQIVIREKEKVQLKITGKERMSKFLIFVELLQQYCTKKQIQFEESYTSEKHVNNYVLALITIAPLLVLIIVLFITFN